MILVAGATSAIGRQLREPVAREGHTTRALTGDPEGRSCRLAWRSYRDDPSRHDTMTHWQEGVATVFRHPRDTESTRIFDLIGSRCLALLPSKQ